LLGSEDNYLKNQLDLLDILKCPNHPTGGDLIQYSGMLYCADCGGEFPIVDGIPVMLPSRRLNNGFLAAERQQWDDQASMYEARRNRDAIYMAGIRSVISHLAASTGDRILDAACRTGMTIRSYQRSSIRIIALDLSLKSLLYLRHRLPRQSKVDLVCGDLTALPFAAETFDKVVCANALQHLPDAELRRRTVGELARVARPSAKVIVSVHNYSRAKERAGWVKEGPAGGHSGSVQYIYRFTAPEFEVLLAQHFRVLKVTGAGLPLFYRFKLGLLMNCVERIAVNFRFSIRWSNMLVGVAET